MKTMTVMPDLNPAPAPTDDPGAAAWLADARQKFTEYETALHRAEAFYAREKFDAAAAHAGLTAHLAVRPHAGFYASPRLERMLVDIGRRTARPTDWHRPSGPRPLTNILHVVTQVTAVGGLTSMLGNWIRADSARSHSVAFTQHRGGIPDGLRTAIINSGGGVHFLNRKPGALVAWAQALRDLSRGFDAVVLHVYSQDPVPLMAFAEPDKTPPVLLLNHGDHLMWLGVSISDVVINLRDAAADLSITRRGAEPRRNVMAPTIVAPATRARARAEAKRELGLPEDSIFLFSAARGMKYRSVNGVSFAAPHVELLKRHPKALLWVLGAGDPEDWRAASAAVDGRIRPMPESPDTKLYFEAADIYVDSFPFVSSTSMMEAAGLGTPMVSRFYGAKEGRIFAINHPGIDKPTLHGSTEAEYVAQLERLITDPALREAKGKEGRDSVLFYHTPPSWMQFIENAYATAAALPPVEPTRVFKTDAVETFSHGEPDWRMYDVFGVDRSTDLLKAYAPLMPLPERLAFLRQLKADGVAMSLGERIRLMIPEWIVRRLKDRA